jgi:hypothetical protein
MYNVPLSTQSLLAAYRTLLDNNQELCLDPAVLFPIIKMKQNSRLAKGSDLIASALDGDEFKDYLHFVQQHRHLSFSHQLIVKSEPNHWRMLHIQNFKHKLKILIFETISNKYSHSVVEKIRSMVPDAGIYCYFANSQTIDGIPKTSLQYDFNCAWFALETCFRISNIPDVFKKLDSCPKWYHLSQKFHYEQLNRRAMSTLSVQQRPLWHNVTFLYPEFLGPEFSALFLSAQSKTAYNELSSKAHAFKASQKRGLTFDDALSRRHVEGQKLLAEMYDPHNPLVDVSPVWPNSLPADHYAYFNHAIWYFRLKYLKEIIAWLKKTLDMEVLQLNQQRLNFSMLVKQ